MDKNQVKFPFNTYILRVKECTKEISKGSGNAMLKVIAEVVDEPPMRVDGEEVDVNGYEPKAKYVSPIVEKLSTGEMEITDKCLKAINDFHASLGIDNITKADIPNIEPAHYVGRKFQALMETRMEAMVDRETKKELTNKITGQPITSPVTEIGRLVPSR